MYIVEFYIPGMDEPALTVRLPQVPALGSHHIFTSTQRYFVAREEYNWWGVTLLPGEDVRVKVYLTRIPMFEP